MGSINSVNKQLQTRHSTFNTLNWPICHSCSLALVILQLGRQLLCMLTLSLIGRLDSVGECVICQRTKPHEVTSHSTHTIDHNHRKEKKKKKREIKREKKDFPPCWAVQIHVLCASQSCCFCLCLSVYTGGHCTCTSIA